MLATEEDPLKDTPFCKNCQAPMWPGDAFCSDCGQKKYEGPPSFWKLFGDFFETVFNLDNRLFCTLGALAIPGRLTKFYLAGRQKPFLNPLRSFFLSAIIMLATFTFLLSQFYAADIDHDQMDNHRKGYQMLFNDKVNTSFDSIYQSFPEYDSTLVMDSLYSLLYRNVSADNGAVYFDYQGGLTFESVEVTVDRREMIEYTPEEIVERKGITDWFDRYQVVQQLRIQNANSRGVFVLFSQLIWGLLLLVPLSALALKLIYIRRGKLFIEHFVFSLHTHTAICACFTVATLIFYFFDYPVAYAFAGVLVVIYFLLALKKVYLQPWWKTLVKSFFLFYIYLFIFVLCVVASAIFSIMTY